MVDSGTSKTIVTAETSRLALDKFMDDVGGKIKAQTDHPLVTPTVAALAVAEGTKLTSMRGEVAHRSDLLQQYKASTTRITAWHDEINTDMQTWAGKIEEAGVGRDDIQLLHFHIKGVDDGESPTPVSIESSHAEIANVVQGHLKAEFDIINNITKGIALPPDADNCEIYGTFVEANKDDWKKMTHEGKARKGKKTMHFSLDEVGHDFWLMAQYSAKDEDGQAETSSSVKITII